MTYDHRAALAVGRGGQDRARGFSFFRGGENVSVGGKCHDSAGQGGIDVNRAGLAREGFCEGWKIDLLRDIGQPNH